MGLLKSIPLGHVVQRCELFPSLWYAKAAISCESEFGNFMATGTACSSRMHRAIGGACGEVNERFWSHPMALAARGIEFLQVFDLAGNAVMRVSGAVACGLSSHPAIFAPRDATGIAFGHNRQSAIEHAVMELVERHILCSVWSGQLPLSEIAQQPQISHHTAVDLHTFAAELGGITFVLALVDGMNFMALGAKCSADSRRALVGAVMEAVMLHDDYHVRADGSTHTPPLRHSEKVYAMRDQATRNDVLAHLRSLCRGSKSTPTHGWAGRDALLSALQWDSRQLWIIDFASEAGACVRALHPHAMNPTMIAIQHDPGIPLL